MIWFPSFILPFVISLPTLYIKGTSLVRSLCFPIQFPEILTMIRPRRLFGFSLILFVIQVDGVQIIGVKPPLLVCHVPLELKIFADSSYQASSADLKSCTQITLSSVNVLFLSSSNASLASIMVSEKRSLQLMKQQTPEATFSFSLRSTNVVPATRHLKTIFNGTTSVALLIEFLKVNKLTSFDIAWDLIQSTPDYAPMLKTLKASLAKEGFNLTTTIGSEVDRTDAFHVSKIAAIVDHIFLVPSYNRHYSGAQYPLVDRNLEQAFDSLELNEGVFLKLYSTLNLSWTKIVVGLSLQTLLWKLNAGTTLAGRQFNQTQAVLQLQSYYESCKNVNSTWRLQQQSNPFYKLAVAPTNDKWMIHVDPFTVGRRVDLLRQYGFGGVALYDYYQDDFAGVCNANGKVYPLIHQAGLSMFNSSTKIPFPEIYSNGGLCIPFLGLTNECKGIFNFGTPKLNISSTDFTSSTISSSFAVKKTKAPVQTDPTTAYTSPKYSSENTVMTSLSSSSTTTPTPIADADQTRWSSVSSESLRTEPSLSYVNLPGLAATEIKLDFPSTYSSEIKLPVAESLVTTSVSVNAAAGGFLGKDEIWRDDQTHLSGVTETSALSQNDGSYVTAFDQHIQQSSSPNTDIDAVPTKSLPEIRIRIGNRIESSSASTTMLSTLPPKLAVESEVTAVEKSALPTSEIERATDFAIMPTVPSFEASVATLIQVDTVPASTYDFTGLKLIDEITTVSSNSASVHETFTDTVSLASTERDIQNFPDDKSSEKDASEVTSSVTENISVSRTEQSSLILENNENTSAPAEIDSIATKRTPAFGNQQPSSQYSGSVGDSMEETTSELPSLSSDTRQDWTSPIPSSVAFETLSIETVMESLYGEFALTSEEPQTNDAFSSEITSAGYKGTLSTVPPSPTPNEQLTISEISSASEEISTESHIFSDGFPSTIEVIPPLILSTAQDSTGLLIEHGNLDSASSMASIEGTQFPADFHLSTPSAPIREDVSNTNYNPVSVATTNPPLTKFRLPVKLSVPESSSVIPEPVEDAAFSSTLQPAFDSADAYFSTEQFSTSFRPLVSNSPFFSEFETESSGEQNDVSTLTPIFENEASGDSMSTLEESENVTPGYLNSTDQPATSISESDSPQGYTNEHFTNVEFSTTSAELSDIEGSVVSDESYPTAGIPSIKESSTETESSSTSDSTAVSTTVQPGELTEDNLPSASSMPYNLEATNIPTEIQDLSQYSSSDVPVSDLLSFDAATSAEEQLQDFSSPNSLTSTEETDNDVSLSTTTTTTTTLPILSDASTMDTKLVSDENSILFSTINFSWETSHSEITSPLPDESKIQQSFDGTLKPTENEFASPREEDLFSSGEADYSISSYVYSSSVTTDSSVTSSFQSIDASTEPHDASPSFSTFSTNSPLFSEFEMGSGDESINLPTLLPIFENEGSGEDPTTTVEEPENVTPGFLNATDSSSHQMAISALPSEFAETSSEGSGFEPTLLPNLVDIASTLIIPDIIEASTERLPSSPTGNSAVSSQDDNLSTADLSVDVSAADSQLVSREIYHTTSPSIVDLPIKETASSFIPLVTDENGSGDGTPLFDTLKPTENEFASPGEDDLFSSVEADFSTLSHVSSEQMTTALPSSSSVTTDVSVTSSFQSIDTSTEEQHSSTFSPISSEIEMGSADESFYVPTVIKIFENEGSGEDSTSTMEAEAATDQPTINISNIDSTINPLSSSLADNVSEASTRFNVTTTVSTESTSPRAMTDAKFVEELEETSSTKMAAIFSESLSLVSSSPGSSTEIPYLSSTPPTVSDIPSEPSTSQSTFSPSLTSSQSFTSEVDTVSSLAFSDSNATTSSTAAESGASSESSFGSSSASTEATSSSSISTISITTSNTTHSNSISTVEWVNASDGTTEVLSTTESTTISSSASTISQSTSSLSSSVEPASTAVKSHSTTPSFHTTKFSLPHSELPTTTTTTDPLSNLWNLLISKLNETISLPFSGEYSYVSNFFWSNATSSNLNSEDIKEIPSPAISSPSENTGNWLFETRPFWLFNRPNTESSFSTTTRSPPKETKRTSLPSSPTTSNSLKISTSTPIADLFETRPFWLQRSTTQLRTKSTLSSTPSITTSRESSSTLTSSTKALHTSDSEKSSTTTVTPPSTATALSAQQSSSFNPNVTRGPCTDNCTKESTGNSSVVLVAKDVANNVVLNLNVDAYMGDKRLNSSFNFDKWLEDLNRFLSSPSKPQTEEIKPSPICEVAGNSILLKSLFCPDDSLSTADKMLFPNLTNLTRLLAPAIIANLTTSMNLTQVVPGNATEFANHQSNISSETSTESTVSMSTESSTSLFNSQNGSTTLVTTNLSDVPLPTVLNSSLESFMLNLTELLKDSQLSDLVSAVNNLNHSLPGGFLESLIQSNNSAEDGRFFNKSPAEIDVIDAVTTQAPTSTFSATLSTPEQHDIFAKNFWKANKRNPIRKLQRVAGPGLGIIPSIRRPLRTTAKPVSNIFRSLAKPASSRQ